MKTEKKLFGFLEPIRPFLKKTRLFFAKDTTPNLVLVITLLAISAGAGLGALHSVTEQRIENLREDAFQSAMREVFGGEAVAFAQSGLGGNIFAGYNGGERLLGFAVRVTVRGAGGPIDMVVGVNTILRDVTGVVVVSHREIGDLTRFKEQGAADAMERIAEASSVEREVRT
jgi:Na+-translocating ferredoxin:NAD+ oxidoreductase RnfG subunit